MNPTLSPHAPPSAMVDFTSTVTAGNVPMVIVKAKHTERAMTQIWRQKYSKNETFTCAKLTATTLGCCCSCAFTFLKMASMEGAWLSSSPALCCRWSTEVHSKKYVFDYKIDAFCSNIWSELRDVTFLQQIQLVLFILSWFVLLTLLIVLKKCLQTRNGTHKCFVL